MAGYEMFSAAHYTEGLRRGLAPANCDKCSFGSITKTDQASDECPCCYGTLIMMVAPGSVERQVETLADTTSKSTEKHHDQGGK
ncbi:hypothetical protein CDD82_343 [Ophiocordyceps australis]|uniref:Uncharacterized protein n=1 Tax=Ophiocordyceps australis TaxID=1399860 RepID=A0A2C5YN20_9HYPO|nr:hypothetical protein CDD82_343 [Ophiocordyceps australis]